MLNLNASREILPQPGPTRLPKNAVKEAHRLRLIRAMATVVAKAGYVSVSVADIVKEAKVSRRTFYELYKNKEDCFLDLIKLGSDALLGQLEQSHLHNQLNEATLGEFIKNYLQLLSSEQDFARCILIETFAAGQRAIELRYEITSNISQLMINMHESVAARHPNSIRPTPDIELITYAISSVLTKLIATNSFDQLDQIHQRIMNFINANIRF